MVERVTAFAPASIGNLAVGFDMLGLALDCAGDRVDARRTEQASITIDAVLGLDGELHPYLPADPTRNTASIAAQSFWNAHGDSGGVALTVRKGVPLQSGMGSSAASAVAAVVAVNGLLDEPRPFTDLLPHALEGEKFASGSLHADNVAPSLIGGLVLCPVTLLPDVVRLPVPTGISAVLLHPNLQVNTAQARKNLKGQYPLALWLEQQGYLATFIAACAADDHRLLRHCLRDVIIEPQRAQAVACFAAVKDAALDGGALGCSLSGSGPSIFALTDTRRARNLAMAMEQACRRQGIECQTWVSSLAAAGARVET
jgi:homoserine kinase